MQLFNFCRDLKNMGVKIVIVSFPKYQERYFFIPLFFYITLRFIILFRNVSVARCPVTIFVVQVPSRFVPNFPGDKSAPVCAVCAHKISSLYFYHFGSFAHQLGPDKCMQGTWITENVQILPVIDNQQVATPLNFPNSKVAQCRDCFNIDGGHCFCMFSLTFV